jgi:hypothetical protein
LSKSLKGFKFWIYYNANEEKVGQGTRQLVETYCTKVARCSPKNISTCLEKKFGHHEGLIKKVGSYGPYIPRPLLLTHGGLRLTNSLILQCCDLHIEKPLPHNFVECSQARHA